MRTDYKYRSELRGLSEYNHRSRRGLIALLGLSLCVGVIYASLELAGDKPAQAAESSADPGVAEQQVSGPVEQTPEPGPARSGMEWKQVALALPPAPGFNTEEKKLPGTAMITTPADHPRLSKKAGAMAHAGPPLEPIETTALPSPPRKAPAAAEQSQESNSSSSIVSAPDSEEVANPADPSNLDMDPGQWLEEEVRSGDSLARIFSRMELSPNLLHRIVNSSKEAKRLARIRPGEKLRVRMSGDGDFQELVHQRSPILSLRILPQEEGFSASLIKRDLEQRITHKSGTIESSLYESAQRAGLPDAMIMDLANIFGWDIDFSLEIRAGDYFSLIYQEDYLDGEKFRNGPILAAEFSNQGKVFRAIRYVDDTGNSSYFSPDGKSMRKAFLRSPVDFRRISSRFTRSRWHPVLGKKRPHRGVDYAAAIGTRVKASGDGRVIYRGRKGGYGKTVIIRHGNQYTTLYGHLSRYSSKVKNGSRVKQGQVIGYVGKTGLATGPHLHYEFRVNGVHRNPLTIKLPAAAPIAKRYREDFKRKSSPLLAQLDRISETMVAEVR